jgi:hypothetical protein
LEKKFLIMNDPIPMQLKKWKTRRELGRGKYILLYGALSWVGISMGIVQILTDAWWEGGFSTRKIVISGIIWPIAGIIFGWSVWKRSEKQYRQFIEAKKMSP